MLPIRIPALVFASSFALLAACRDMPRESPTPAPAPVVSSLRASPSGLTRVTAASLVCMVNARFMGSEQIPVTVDDKTYFGCCAACKQKLQSSVAARTALDPVTRRPVDKATAVIGKTETGEVFYFESEDSFSRYAARN